MTSLVNLSIVISNEQLISSLKTEQELDEHFETNTRLSHESLAILSLIAYCQTSNHANLKTVCYYSLKPIRQHLDRKIHTSLITSLNKKYKGKNFHFIDYHLHTTSEPQDSEFHVLYLRNLRDLQNQSDSFLLDTALPSFTRQLANNKCHFLITGLSSVYREIVTLGDLLKPSLKLINLLVKFIILIISIKIFKIKNRISRILKNRF